MNYTGDSKFFGYDLSKFVKVNYLKLRKTMSFRLKLLTGDKDVLELAIKMRKSWTIDIYIKHLESDNEKDLPKVVLKPIEINDDVDDPNEDTGCKFSTPTLSDFDNDDGVNRHERDDGEEGINLHEAIPGKDIGQNYDETIHGDCDKVGNNVHETVVDEGGFKVDETIVGGDEVGLKIDDIVGGGGDGDKVGFRFDETIVGGVLVMKTLLV